VSVAEHALIPAPGLAEIQAEAWRGRCSAEVAAERLLRMRNEAIRAEALDPIRFGWEPDIWKVCDALLDWPRCEDQGFLRRVRERTGMDWGGWSAGIRKALGFRERIWMLLILGGQRSAKSTYAAKRCVQQMLQKDGARVFPMHMESKRSVAEQQVLIHGFLPPEERRQRQTETEYVKYKVKTGFSENSFILSNLSFCQFKFYSQSMHETLQGLEPDLVAPDELLPPEWVDEIVHRLNTRAGRCICTFTPVEGFSATVRAWCEGATVARTGTGYLAPMDGGDRDEAGALGLSEEELGELRRAVEEKRPARAMQSRSEDCVGWVNDGGGGNDAVGGRRWERMPRVMRCVDPRFAVVFFWSSDNPYGNPKEVAASLRHKPVSGRAGVRERFYGFADRVAAGQFPTFSRQSHVVRGPAIPEGGETYLFVDPARGRNFYMLWIRRVGETAYAVREWPGGYWIPGIGVPGPWAVPSGRRGDGERGTGQGPWGFGLLRYKFEMARVEGWEVWRRWRRDLGGAWSEDAVAPLDEVEEWEEPTEAGEAREIVEGRYVDSRAASEPRIENDRPVTLLTDLERIGLRFGLAPGKDVSDRIQRIRNGLEGETEGARQEGADETRWVRRPRLLVSEECRNLIFSLETWKWTPPEGEGERGACKDPIDTLGWFFDEGLDDEGREEVRSYGGVNYGRSRKVSRFKSARERLAWMRR
jgi:hypothetical protein